MKIKSLIVALVALVASTATFAQDATTDVNKLWNEAVPLLNAKNYAEALPILEKTLEAAYDADVIEMVEKVQKYIPTCYFQIGLADMKVRNTDSALANFTKADELAKLYNNAKVSRDAKSAIAKLYKMLGASRSIAKTMQQQLRCSQKVTRLTPRIPNLLSIWQ